MLKTKDILDEKEKILHEKALEATFPLEKEDIKLINDAYEYLRLSQDEEKAEKLDLRPGMGLAFPQLGKLKRIFIIDLYEENVEPYVFINPEIIKAKGEQTVEEGCLSFPNKFAKIVRPKEVVVRALNEKGEKFEIKAKDLFAQAISHETDHLNGELFIDKIIPGTLEILTPEQKD